LINEGGKLGGEAGRRSWGKELGGGAGRRSWEEIRERREGSEYEKMNN